MEIIKSVLKEHYETVYETHEVKIKIWPRQIITVIVETQDGSVMSVEGKGKKDEKIVNGLSDAAKNKLSDFLEENLNT
jgi:hypothetical protein